MRPCARSMCLYESMLSGEITMLDVQRMNDALDVIDENDRRASAARHRK